MPIISKCHYCGQTRKVFKEHGTGFYHCDTCRIRQKRESDPEFKAKLKANSKRWRERNPERHRECVRKWQEKNHDRLLAYRRQWWRGYYRKNRSKILAQKRKKYRHEHE